MTTERVDKWLWSMRVFKTRSIAINFCKNGRVWVNEMPAKPSREIKIGDTVKVRKPPITYTFRVVAIPNGRVGAKLVPDYMENITPPDELQKLDPSFMAFGISRDRGTGRPTKKERRSLDEMFGADFDGFDWDEEV